MSIRSFHQAVMVLSLGALIVLAVSFVVVTHPGQASPTIKAPAPIATQTNIVPAEAHRDVTDWTMATGDQSAN